MHLTNILCWTNFTITEMKIQNGCWQRPVKKSAHKKKLITTKPNYYKNCTAMPNTES